MYTSPFQSTVVWTTLDPVNGNFLKFTFGDSLLFRGLGTATVLSVPDLFGRTADIPIVPGGGIQIVAPLVQAGFMQPDGSLYIDSVGAVEVAFLSTTR
jgi:hypothetical protein